MVSLLVSLSLLSAVRCQAAPVSAAPAAAFRALGLPAPISKRRLRDLLQSFVTDGYGKCFRHLGDERDFDHGHFLLDAKTGAPVAILYHTQELAYAPAAPDFGYLDTAARNWIQWLDGRGIENARRYERSTYPHTASWEWFVARDLPRLKERYTIIDKMLDPALIGEPLAPGLQWTFTRVPCGKAAADDDSAVIDVTLPDKTDVCLALGSS